MAEVETTRAGTTLTITLNRPDRPNACDDAMLDQHAADAFAVRVAEASATSILAEQAEAQGVAVLTHDSDEGIAAFREKRKAGFEGR